MLADLLTWIFLIPPTALSVALFVMAWEEYRDR